MLFHLSQLIHWKASSIFPHIVLIYSFENIDYSQPGIVVILFHRRVRKSASETLFCLEMWLIRSNSSENILGSQTDSLGVFKVKTFNAFLRASLIQFGHTLDYNPHKYILAFVNPCFQTIIVNIKYDTIHTCSIEIHIFRFYFFWKRYSKCFRRFCVLCYDFEYLLVIVRLFF